MKKFAAGLIIVLAYGAFYATNSYKKDKTCEAIKDFDDATQVGLKILEDSPQLWNAYYSTTEDMRRSATYGHMGTPGRMDSFTLTGIQRNWTYKLNLQCTQNGGIRYCRHILVGFDQCGR